MTKNPILKLIAGYLQQERRIKSILIVDMANPNELTFVLENNQRVHHKVNPKNRTEFLGWWTQATSFLHLKLEPIAKTKKAPAKKPSTKTAKMPKK